VEEKENYIQRLFPRVNAINDPEIRKKSLISGGGPGRRVILKELKTSANGSP